MYNDEALGNHFLHLIIIKNRNIIMRQCSAFAHDFSVIPKVLKN